MKATLNPYAGTPAIYKETFPNPGILELTDYREVVYPDADAGVCHNTDVLFDKPGWSAVNADGVPPEYADWINLNAGLMVIEPNLIESEKMLLPKNVLPSQDGGDQGFRHNQFPEWPRLTELLKLVEEEKQQEKDR